MPTTGIDFGRGTSAPVGATGVGLGMSDVRSMGGVVAAGAPRRLQAFQRRSVEEVAPLVGGLPFGPPCPVPSRVATSLARPSNALGVLESAAVPDAEILDAPGAGAAVARGGALRVGAYAAGQAMAIVAAALLFRHLGVDDAGRYVPVLSLAAIVQGLADVGLGTLATRQLALAP